MDRVSTGIPGLDTMAEGGLIPGRTYLIVGGPGAGKTILCFQFLMEGVKKGEKCLYVSLEERTEALKSDMSQFGWDISRIKILDTMKDISSGMWALKVPGQISKQEFSLKALVENISEVIKQHHPTRIVVDSATSIKMLYENDSIARKELLGFMNFLESTECTSLITSEVSGKDIIMEEYLSSGVIKMHQLDNEGERVSAISIQKFRGSKFDKHTRPFKITEKGVVVFEKESVFG